MKQLEVLIDKTFKFKDDLSKAAENTLAFIAAQHKNKSNFFLRKHDKTTKQFTNNTGHLQNFKSPRRYYKRKALATANTDTTFVGIHSRYQ